MQISNSSVHARKWAFVAIASIFAVVIAAGCADPDSHPSQMVKMRDQQMAQQRDGMKGNAGAPPMPPGKGPSSAGGQ